MISLKRSYQILFILGLFFIPFNSNVPKWLGFLGEFSTDSSPLFFLISFLLLLTHQVLIGKIYFPFSSNIYRFFLLFFGVLFLSVLMNLPNVWNYYFKQTSGIERFIRQIISILFSGFIFFYVFINVCRDYGVIGFFKLVRKIFYISFIFVFTCGLLEYFIVTYNLTQLIPIIRVYNLLPFVKIKLFFDLQRISSLTFEPPALGTYLITISGFMFSYILTSTKRSRVLPFLLVLVLAVISKSRTALVVVIVQSLIGVACAYYMYFDFRKTMNRVLIYGSIVTLGFGVFFKDSIYNSVSEKIQMLDFTRMNNKLDDNSISNKSRLGIQLAMLETYKKYPVFGTGWGQQAFESHRHYPRWAMNNNYEFPTKYLNQKNKSFPPGYNLYLRILTETGIVGLLAFLLFLTIVFLTTFRLYKLNEKYKYIAVALLITFVGMSLNWFQIDSLRLYGFWFSLAILIRFKKYFDEQTDSVNTTL